MSDWIHAFHAMAAAATWLINSSISAFGLLAKDSGNVCSANICSSLFVIVTFSPNRKLATPHRKRAYVRPRLDRYCRHLGSGGPVTLRRGGPTSFTIKRY